MQHADLWRAIDRLAMEMGLSASALARLAGLDPTTFNQSKRISPQGKQRWPSTESIAKLLEATDASLAHFVALIEAEDAPARAAGVSPALSVKQRTAAAAREAAAAADQASKTL